MADGADAVTHDAAVISAIYGDYDVLKPALPQVDASGNPLDVDWVLVTDDQRLESVPEYLGWRVVYSPQPGVRPVVAAKTPKLCPWLYTDAPASVWVDASYRVTSPRFVSEALALADPIAQFVHPTRDCALEEAAFSATLPKYAGEPLLAQADTYRACGHPEHWGLWAAGVIARRHTEDVVLLSSLWSWQLMAWSHQDQVSEPYALRMCGLRPASLPGDHLHNPWLSYEGSARH